MNFTANNSATPTFWQASSAAAVDRVKHAAQAASAEQFAPQANSQVAGPRTPQQFDRLMHEAQHKSADQGRQAARELVSSTLILPLLKQMQNDPLRSDLLRSGMAEDAFAAKLHQNIADRLVQRLDQGFDQYQGKELPTKQVGFGLVDTIYRSMKRQVGGEDTAGKVDRVG